MNLQHFAEEPETENVESETPEVEDFTKYITEDGGLDTDSLISDYENKEKDDDGNNQLETETDPDLSEKGAGDPESHEDETHVNQDETTKPEDEEKKTPDAAFAEMRRRAEQNEAMAKWVQDLATKQGFTDPDQLINEFNKQQLAKEAQEKGVPVDVYERLQQLETENKQKDEVAFQERFNNEVASTKDKYSLNDSQIQETFTFMAQRGFIDEEGRTSIPFEDAYTLANKDTFIEQAKEQAKQDYLKGLEQKQKATTTNPGTGATDAKTSDEIDVSTFDVFNYLKDKDIDY